MLSVAHTVCAQDLFYTVEQNLPPLASYVLKYCSKSSLLIFPCSGTPSKWHAQAQMLSHALPTDVVCVIGEHVREQAAVLVQKWVRGAAVRVGHRGQVACLCDMDGNLVYL